MTSRVRTRLLFFWTIVVLGCNASVLQAQRERMVIAADAVCRSEPNVSAAKVHSYQLGDLAIVTKESQEEGTVWYFDSSCWIYGALTTEFSESNPEPSALALIDHLLQRPNEARFEDYVMVENKLAEFPFASVVRSSGLLQFRKLTLVKQAVLRNDMRGRTLAKDPLKKAWVLLHGDLVFYFDPDDGWFVRPEAYWDLYEKYKQEPWAEDLAWTAAQLPIPSDECYADCVLGKIDRTFLQYWTRFPKGSKVSQALTEATPMAKYAVDLACSSNDTDFSVPRPLLEKIRTSLAGVTAPEKRQLLDYLAQIEQKCYPDRR